MPAPLRRVLLCLLVAALAAAAHLPLAHAGFSGGDLDLLAEVAAATREGKAGFPSWFDGGAVRPLPAAILSWRESFAGDVHPLEPWAALPLRGVSLAALLLAASGAAITLRRVLVPWLGESAARAAGWATAGIVVAHPASVAAVARPGALGDLCAVASGAWCVAFFLLGRQHRNSGLLVLAALLAVVAGFSSRVAWILPFLLFGLELTSARRPRPGAARASSAFVVFAVAFLCVAVEPARSWSEHLGNRGFDAWFAHPWGERALVAVESLGVLVLPAPAPGAAWVYVVAGALLLVALEPLLRAVRAAPRLWGWLILGWLIALVGALLLASDVRVPPGRIEIAQSLWPASVVVCAGLAAASAALGGARRTLMPILVAGGLCWIAHGTSAHFPRATKELLALRGELEKALQLAGADGHVLAVDVPLNLGGSEPERAAEPRAPGALGVPEHLDAVGRLWSERLWPPTQSRIRRVVREQLPYLLRMDVGRRWRTEGLAVSLPVHPGQPGASRLALRVPPPGPPAKPFVWRENGRSDPLDGVDPFQLLTVRVTPRRNASTGAPPRMGWRSTSKEFEIGAIQGAWVQTDDGPRAVFDLSRSLEWLLGGMVKRIWFENQLLEIDSAEVLPSLPLEVDLAAGLADEGRFEVPLAARPRPLLGEARWCLVRLGAWPGMYRVREASPEGDERVVVPGFHASAPLCIGDDPGYEYVLECRIDGAVVARTPFVRAPGL